MKKIIHVAKIKKPLAQVFRAISTQQGLSSWWSTAVKAEAARVGLVVHFTFFGDFNPEMEIVALDEPALLKWKCVGGHDNWKGNEFEWKQSWRSAGSQSWRARGARD